MKSSEIYFMVMFLLNGYLYWSKIEMSIFSDFRLCSLCKTSLFPDKSVSWYYKNHLERWIYFHIYILPSPSSLFALFLLFFHIFLASSTQMKHMNFIELYFCAISSNKTLSSFSTYKPNVIKRFLNNEQPLCGWEMTKLLHLDPCKSTFEDFSISLNFLYISKKLIFMSVMFGNFSSSSDSLSCEL